MARQIGEQLKATPPDQFAMDLFAPGMTMLHRAGLGGLACTLKYIEGARRGGQLDDQGIPGAPWDDDRPPWDITPSSVVLRFGQPQGAGEFLNRLFRIAFSVQGGLIRLPGQYGSLDPPQYVLAELQNALLLTFLQHGKVRSLASEQTTVSYDPEGDGAHVLTLSFKPCTKYKHQDLWRPFVNPKGMLKQKAVEVVGPVNPGAIVRHVAFQSRTKIADDPRRVLPLCFAMVGSLALSANRRVGLLVVPDVSDLLAFAYDRPLMTPTTARECRVTSASDAVLQVQLRLRARRTAQQGDVPACTGIAFAPTPWASQQKSRTAAVTVDAGDDATLDLFERAMLELPPRIRTKTVSEGRGASKTTRQEHFWVDSTIRPLIADNLATGKPWYANFRQLMTCPDKARKTTYERKGLHAMVDRIAWDDAGAETVVKAVHEAIRQRFGRIADENRGNPVAMKKRWGGERERWRMAFAGAKTADQFRNALADLWSRAGNNPVLKEAWRTVLPMLQEGRWKLTRDLALVGLASYAGKESEEMEITEPTNEGESE